MTAKLFAIALLFSLIAITIPCAALDKAESPLATLDKDKVPNEPVHNQVTFSPVGETWATNAFNISIQTCAVNMPDLSFSINTAVYRLRPGDTVDNTLGEATVLKQHKGLKEGTLAFVIGRGRERQSVPCEGAGALYGDLPPFPVTFRLTRTDGDLFCTRVEN